MGRLRLFFFILFFCINNTSADPKIITRIFNFLDPIEDRLTFEQNKHLLKLIVYNRNILFKELTKNNPPSYQISQIFLKLAVFTSKNFDQIAPRDRDFHFHKDQLYRFWSFIIKKLNLLIQSEGTISDDVKFTKTVFSEDVRK